jgi:alpha-L-rhamnosidase
MIAVESASVATSPEIERMVVGPTIVDMKIEHARTPLGLDARPRFSWRIAGGCADVFQVARRIVVSDLESGDVPQIIWDSGRIDASDSLFIEYGGGALPGLARFAWRVTVWTEDGGAITSQDGYFETGLEEGAVWTGRWIAPALKQRPKKGLKTQPADYLRRQFTLDGTVRRARLRATALGVYQASINGVLVSDERLRPGFTVYPKRLQYQTYDVTALLVTGDNCIGVILGEGWYAGQHGIFKYRDNFGEQTALLAELDVVFEDGRRVVIGTDDGWTWSEGPLRVSDLHEGEVFDARADLPGWDHVDAAAAVVDRFRKVRMAPPLAVAPVAQRGPSVRPIETISPVDLKRDQQGRLVVDFGQCIAGWTRLRVAPAPGAVILAEFGETLDGKGDFCADNYWKTVQTVRVIGDGTERVHEPTFCYFGFRYVRLSGVPENFAADAIEAVVAHSDIEPRLAFRCSDERLGKLQNAIAWSTKGNFVEIPTDCPQREKCGVTGDIIIFQRTAAYNMDTSSVLARWLLDVAADQYSDGCLSLAVPNTGSYMPGRGPFGRFNTGPAGWSETLAVMPWELFVFEGDRRILEETYTAAVRWMAFMEQRARTRPSLLSWQPGNIFDPPEWSRSPYIVNRGFTFGDWACPDVPFPAHLVARLLNAPAALSTAYYGRTAEAMAKIAAELGRDEDAQRFGSLHAGIRAAYARAFIDAAGRHRAPSQAAYAIALGCGMVPDDLKTVAAAHLADLVRANGYRLTTGFLGTQFLCTALARNGQFDTAMALLMQDACPSWLHWIDRGATTMWEAWKPIDERGKVGPYSFNHFVYGVVGEFIYEDVVGLRPDESGPGFRRFRVAPQMPRHLPQLDFTFRSPMGDIRIAWSTQGDDVRFDLATPPNTEAQVILPNARFTELSLDVAPIIAAEGLSDFRQDGRDVSFRARSGRRTFRWRIAQ